MSDASELSVRWAGADDAQAIAAIHVAAWREAYRGLLPDAWLQAQSIDARLGFWRQAVLQPQRVLVACRQHTVVGWLDQGPSRDDDQPPGMGEVYALYVDPPAWSQGAGTLLLRSACQNLAALGHRAVSLWVLEHNHRAIAFYRRHGLVPDAVAAKEIARGGVLLREQRYVMHLAQSATC